MSDRTGISWTDSTWNPVRGCSRVSAGCQHCYAETIAARFSKPGQAYAGLTDAHGRWNGVTRVIEHHLADPLRWQQPRKIFVNSMSDLFHESLSDAAIDRVFDVILHARLHTYQILTKRPERMWDYVTGWYARNGFSPSLPEPHVWLGVSVEGQATADARIPTLLRTPAAVRFISAEPLLGPVELTPYLRPTRWYPVECKHGYDACPECDATVGKALDWVIVGGESGPGHRSMDADWAEAIAGQCDAARVPLFVKQDSGPRAGQQGRLSDDLWRCKDFPVARP